MLRAERLGYVLLNVKDLERSVKYYTRVLPMDVSERTPDRVYLRGGLQHHWLALQQSDTPGMARLGIEMSSMQELNEMEARLREKGVPVQSGNGLESDRVLRYVRFEDPSGNPLELYADMVSMPRAPLARPSKLDDIQHVVLSVHDIDVGHDFYVNVLGMQVSDWIEHSTAFMRFRNGWHHGIGIGAGRGAKNGLNHIAFMPPDLESTMRIRAIAKALKQPLVTDITRHTGSESCGIYLGGPDTVIECSFGGRNIPEDVEHKPRMLMTRGIGADMWQPDSQDPWLREEEDEQTIVTELREAAGVR